MSGVNFTEENYLSVCKTQPVEVKSLLIDELNFTVDGLKEVYERRPEESSVFFSEFIGEVFTATDGQVTKVLEKGFSGPENMAKVMLFMYNNQKEKEKESKMESTSVEKEKGKGRGRSKIDWTSMKIPFTEKTKQYVVFEELMRFDGGKNAFFDHISKVFEQKQLVTRNMNTLIAGTILDATTRGWKISLVEDKYKVEKVPVVEA